MEKTTEVSENGQRIVEKKGRPKYKLEDLIAEMPEGLSLVEGWDDMQPVGLEVLGE